MKNIEKTPQVTISVGRRSFRALASRLSPEEAESKVIDYVRQHPRLIRYLPRLGIVIAFEPMPPLPSGKG
ncbi:MAG: hypothetical protein NVSMB27_17600 [Ktedonobacteraceae bacterium]